MIYCVRRKYPTLKQIACQRDLFETFNFIYFDTSSSIHPGFLFTVSLMPFSTAFICQFFIYRLVFNTYVSIAFIVLVQLNYVIAPGRGPLSRH